MRIRSACIAYAAVVLCALVPRGIVKAQGSGAGGPVTAWSTVTSYLGIENFRCDCTLTPASRNAPQRFVFRSEPMVLGVMRGSASWGILARGDFITHIDGVSVLTRDGARRLAEARDAMRANVYSRRETFARLVLTRAGLPEPEPNGGIVLRSGRRTRGDLVFRTHKVLVEYEGEQHLFDVRQWATDVARLNDLIDDGWWVIRITKAMPAAELIARTARALAERGWIGAVARSK